MAEVEYKGIKVGGSKLLLIIPLIGTIIGGIISSSLEPPTFIPLYSTSAIRLSYTP